MEDKKTEVLVRKNMLAQLFDSALQSKANMLAEDKEGRLWRKRT